MTGGTAFGWAGNTHSLLCQRNFDLPVVSQFLGGINQSAIENYTSEPSQTSHDVQWDNLIQGRKYLSTSGACSNGFWLWGLDETTRLKYLMHHLGDVSVPSHHRPAAYAYDSLWAEGISEAAAAGGYGAVGELPNVANTSIHTHTQNGHTYNFTGTIYDVIDEFFDACRDNATYYKGGVLSRVASANWNALAIDLMLQRAVMVDYFLAKQNAVAIPEAYYTPTRDVYFYGSSSYDTDNISWNADGTYSNTGGGIVQYAWDFNNDVVFDHFSSNSMVVMSAADLIAMGCTAGAWNTYAFSVLDDEGKWSETAGSFYLPVTGLPEPATLSLLTIGGLALLRRKR